MSQGPFDQELGSRVLEQIHEGMEVYDSQDNKIGTVERVFLGAIDEEALARGLGPMTATDPDARGEGSLVEEIAAAIAGADEMPEVVRDRLLQHGFIRIDRGFLQSGLYALPGHVDRVAGDRVSLRVPGDGLIAL